MKAQEYGVEKEHTEWVDSCTAAAPGEFPPHPGQASGSGTAEDIDQQLESDETQQVSGAPKGP